METYFESRVAAATAGVFAIEESLRMAEGYVPYEPTELRLLDALEAIGLLARQYCVNVDALFERASQLRARRQEHLLPRPQAVVTVELSTSTDRWLTALARANGVAPDVLLATVARSLADHAGRRPTAPEATAAFALFAALDYAFVPEDDVFTELLKADSQEIRESMPRREVAANA